MKNLNLKSYVCEFTGTLLLTFFGCATACTVGTNVDGGYLMTALSFGLILTVLCYIIGPVSGCHVNPAVTIAMFINKKIDLRNTIIYIISQILGAVAGGLILSLIFKPAYGLGANAAASDGILLSLVLECILTFTFVLAIFGATSKKENSSVSGVIIGGALTLVHIVGIGFTGTSVNPARSIGPALFAGIDYIADLWIFVSAPVVGAALAAFLWKFINNKK